MPFNDIEMEQIWNHHMYQACEDGDLTTVIKYVSKGFNVNHISGAEHNEETPLFVAAQYGQTHVVEYLLDNGAFVNDMHDMYEIEESWTPLQIAACYEHADVVKLLLSRGALHRNTMLEAIRRDHVEIVRVLLDCGVTHDDVLLLAVQNLRPYIVKMLLVERRASVTPKVLELIKKHDFGEITQMILEHQMGQLKV